MRFRFPCLQPASSRRCGKNSSLPMRFQRGCAPRSLDICDLPPGPGQGQHRSRRGRFIRFVCHPFATPERTADFRQGIHLDTTLATSRVPDCALIPVFRELKLGEPEAGRLISAYAPHKCLPPGGLALKGAVQIRLAAPLLSATASNLIQRKCAWGPKSEASEYDECRDQPLGIQTRLFGSLPLSRPGDRLDREADRAARHVLRMSDAPFGRGFAHDFSQERERDRPRVAGEPQASGCIGRCARSSNKSPRSDEELISWRQS
jgi:hypothetical protein